jgi:hypothetical protein
MTLATLAQSLPRPAAAAADIASSAAFTFHTLPVQSPGRSFLVEELDRFSSFEGARL